MKLIIAGGRDYAFDERDAERLDELHALESVTEVVSGHSSGADRDGERWAASRGIPVRLFRADWRTHGPSAGPRRNRQMADYADAVALFPGGRGTESMAREAQRAGLRIFDFTKTQKEVLSVEY